MEFYIDRGGEKTDAAATGNVIGLRCRIYKGAKMVGQNTGDQDSEEWNNPPDKMLIPLPEPNSNINTGTLIVAQIGTPLHLIA